MCVRVICHCKYHTDSNFHVQPVETRRLVGSNMNLAIANLSTALLTELRTDLRDPRLPLTEIDHVILLRQAQRG